MTINISKSAFLFPGQGSQSVGMGKDLAAQNETARSIFEKADSILGFEISKLMWEGPDVDLNDTLNTQPALFIHSMAAYQAFKQAHPRVAPTYMAGHSLGELSAITAAGALSFEDGLRLVRKRGELMKRAGEQNPGGMAAVLGLDIPTLEVVCAEASTPKEIVQVANDNSPGQVVISGHKPALERAMEGAKAAGAKRAIPLAVSIAAHSPLMDSIQAEWNAAVNEAAFSDAAIFVVGNVTAKPLQKAVDLRADVQAQMQSRVRWVESVQWMASQGVIHFVEVGTGAVLAGLTKRIQSDVSTHPLGNPADFEAIND